MPAKLSTTVGKIPLLSNAEDATLITKFHGFMKENVTTTQLLYDALQQDPSISKQHKNDIAGQFASFGICRDNNKDLWCSRGETRLSHGFTSWTALYEFDQLGHHKIFFTYAGTNNLSGRP
jgi:hypothetical protein